MMMMTVIGYWALYSLLFDGSRPGWLIRIWNKDRIGAHCAWNVRTFCS